MSILRGKILLPLPQRYTGTSYNNAGTSEPKSFANSMSSKSEQFKPSRLAKPSNVVAAFELPPPSPAENGMIFLMLIL